MTMATSVHDLRLIGEHLALDFCNTISEATDGTPHDHLVDYAALVAWSVRRGLLTRAEATALRKRAMGQAAAAARVLEDARDLRGAVFALCRAQAAGEPVPGVARFRFNRHLSTALTHTKLGDTRRGLVWTWIGAADVFDRMLWPIAREAAELLVGPQRERIRMCGGAHCHWLFLDLTKNRTRRWCSMEVCGNRSKVRSFRSRANAAHRP
jgi:predicted RNA-binding Zn ribbon-like protein